MRLIRIHTLADAGVPLARVQELLDASPVEFARGVQEIDKKLRAEIRRLQGTRERLARLAAGDHLALPQSVVDYLDRLRGLGVEERCIEMERDAWIMVAAQVPHLIDSVIAKKHEHDGCGDFACESEHGCVAEVSRADAVGDDHSDEADSGGRNSERVESLGGPLAPRCQLCG